MYTPRGEQGFFHETWDKSTGWQKIEVPWQQCPRIDPSFIEEECRERGSAWVAQEYECQFIAAGATWVQKSWLKYEDCAPAGLTIALGIDLAISEKEMVDYTAGSVLGRDMAGNLHVLDVQRIRGSFSQQIEFIKQLAAQTLLNIRGIKPISDKVSRFALLEARYELGQVYHVRGLPREFEAELLSFPIGAHDDMVDSLAYAWQALSFMPAETRLVFPGDTEKPAWK